MRFDMRKWLAVTLALSLVAGPLQAQTPVQVTNQRTDTEDGTVSGSQTNVQLTIGAVYVWNGSNLVRLEGTAANGAEVDVTRVQGSVTVTDGAGALNVIVDSGTVTANAGTDLNTSALLTTSAHDGAFGTAGTADAQVRTIQGIASMTPVQVSQATASNLNATVTDGSGALTVDGTVTVTATDLDVQIGGSDSLTIGTLPNEGQQTAANSISVTPDTDNDPIGAPAAAVPGEAVLVGGTDGTNLTVPYIDPCEREARTVYRVDIATATTTEIAAATASEYYYVCSINLITAAANNVIIVEDDTATNCPSPTAGVSSGGTTAAEGWNFAANGGLVAGNGQKWVMKTGTANRSFCIITSAATQLSGTITYVSAP